jgi:predicted ATP-dependent serine protease
MPIDDKKEGNCNQCHLNFSIDEAIHEAHPMSKEKNYTETKATAKTKQNKTSYIKTPKNVKKEMRRTKSKTKLRTFIIMSI